MLRRDIHIMYIYVYIENICIHILILYTYNMYKHILNEPCLAGEEHDGVGGVHVGHVVGEHADADLGIVSHYIIRHYCHCVAVVVVLYAYNLLRDELAVDGGALGPQ